MTAAHLDRGRRQLAELHRELCGCGECRELDRRHPREGRQLALLPTGEPPIATQQVLL